MNTSDIANQERCYYIDWLRVLGMLVVFLFHSARFFDSMVGWHVKNGQQHICHNLKLFSIHTDGCFGEYAKIPAICARKIPESISPEIGAVLEPLGTALRAARERPHAPILCLTPFIKTARYMAVAWGVHAVTVDVANEHADINEVIIAAKEIAVRETFASTGEPVIIAAGLPFGTSGTTNLLHVAWVD